MSGAHLENFIPFRSHGKELQVRTADELKLLVIGSDEVREVIA